MLRTRRTLLLQLLQQRLLTFRGFTNVAVAKTLLDGLLMRGEKIGWLVLSALPDRLSLHTLLTDTTTKMVKLPRQSCSTHDWLGMCSSLSILRQWRQHIFRAQFIQQLKRCQMQLEHTNSATSTTFDLFIFGRLGFHILWCYFVATTGVLLLGLFSFSLVLFHVLEHIRL